MRVTVEEVKTLDIERKVVFGITRTTLRYAFGMPKFCCISAEGDLVLIKRDPNGRELNPYSKAIRKATDRDRLYFAVLEVLKVSEEGK